MSIRIIVADDHAVVRHGLSQAIQQENDMEMVGQSSDGHSTVEMARELLPDIVLMDISMPDLNGIEATREIQREAPGVKVIALSMHSAKRYVTEMFRAGAFGYLTKDCDFDELARAIRSVADGKTYISPSIGNVVVEDLVHTEELGEVTAFTLLTQRERKVLQLLAEGQTAKQAGLYLHLSPKTVVTYRRQIMDKVEIDDFVQLVRYAIQQGLTGAEPNPETAEAPMNLPNPEGNPIGQTLDARHSTLEVPILTEDVRFVSPDLGAPTMSLSSPPANAGAVRRQDQMIIKLILADAHTHFRAGLSRLLSAQEDFDVVGQTGDGYSTVELARELLPDIVVVDISIPGLNGIEATRDIQREAPGVKVIGLSMRSAKRDIREMFRAGASGYLLKNCDFHELARAIRTVADYKTYISPSISNVVVEGIVEDRVHTEDLGERTAFTLLTQREREVLQLLAEGRTTKQIALHLHISPKSVEAHRLRVMFKLEIDNVAQLVKYAIQEGLAEES